MDKSYTITLSGGDLQSPIRLDGVIPADDWKAILGFQEQYDRLNACLREMGGFDTGITMSWSRSDPIRVEPSSDIQERDIASILLRFRPFYLKPNRPDTTDLSFHRTANRIMRSIAMGRAAGPESEEVYAHMKRHFEELKDLFDGKQGRRVVAINYVNPREGIDMPINDDEMFKKWLNAYEYHQDDKKRQKIESIERGLGIRAGSMRNHMLPLLGDKLYAIQCLAYLIHGLINS